MKYYEVNGKRIEIKPTNSRFAKTAYSIFQDILKSFKRIGITPEFINLTLPRNPLKNDLPAEVAWIVNAKDHYYMCNTQSNYRDNLGVISKVIEMDSYAIRNGMKSFAQVMNQYRLGYEPNGEKILTPREILGIHDSIKDIDYIDYIYKKKAKELHPDMPTGDTEKFKQVNDAYQQLKEELSK